MPIALQWILAVVILCAYTVVAFLLVNLIAEYSISKIKKKKNEKRRQRFVKIIRVIFESDQAQKNERLKLSFNDIYDIPEGAERATSLLIKELTSIHTNILENGDDTNPQYADEIFDIIVHLQKESPFSGLPDRDRKALLGIRAMLDKLQQPSVSEVLLANIVDLLSDKNKELESNKTEEKKARQISKWSLVVGVIMACWTFFTYFSNKG